jgi:glycerophosphoryl diester phosphodiesterase
MMGAVLCAPQGRSQRSEARRILVAAHRGGAGISPENTLTAYRKAIRLHCDYIELDVRTTADGRLIIMHDRTVDRTTDGTGEVSALTWDYISHLNANKRPGERKEPVPTFEQVARLCRGRIGLYIDHKAAAVSAVLDTLDRTNFGTKLVVYGGMDTLKEYRRLRPTLAIMPGHPDTAEQMELLVSALQPETMDGHMTEWTKEQVTSAHRHKATVWMDVMGATDCETGWLQAIGMGADALQTDYPDRLIPFLKSNGLRD